MHVVCGECEGVDAEERRTQRDAMAKHWRSGYATLVRAKAKRKGQTVGDAVLGTGRSAAVDCVAAAQRALAKREGAATSEEVEALRRTLAGDVPDIGVTAEERARKEAARAVGAAVRGAQEAAARFGERRGRRQVQRN